VSSFQFLSRINRVLFAANSYTQCISLLLSILSALNASRKNLAYSAARSFFGVLRDTNFNSLRTTNNIANGVRLWCSAGYQLQFSENHQQYCQWCQTCLHNHPGLMALLAHKHIICHLDEHEQQLHLIELSEGDLVVQMGSHP